MRNLALPACGCLWALAVATGAAPGADEPPPVPKEVMTEVQRILELAGAPFHSPADKRTPAEQQEKVLQAGRKYDEAFDRLADRVDEALVKRLSAAEGRDIEAKLVLLAWDRKKREQVHKEIDATYFRAPLDPSKRVPTARGVEQAHAAEPYRLAWEYFLLRPDAHPFPHSPQARAVEALSAIHNSSSVMTLVQRYRLTCREGVPSKQVDTEQTLLLIGLSAFRTEQGLRGMLECAALSRKQQSKEGKDKSYWDAEGFVHDVLTDRLNRGTRQEWLKLIAAFPREGLTAEQRQLLEKARR